MLEPTSVGDLLHEGYIEDHRADGLRSGEGCLAALPNGDLLLVYGRFEGPRDADRATLVERVSRDGGRTWSQARVFRETPPEAWNLMSVSLLTLADGRLGAAYCRKNSLADCRPRFMTRPADGAWSEPVLPIAEEGYHVVNNDRLVQLRSGRLLIPFAYHGRPMDRSLRPRCGCAISDDAGATWRTGATIAIEPEHVRRPACLDPSNADAVRLIERGEVHAQEPGVVERSDGRVMMWCRSTGGYAYRAFSDDGGASWSAFEAIPEFAMPCGPQSIRALPGSNRWIMLYNDRGTMPFGSPQFQWRRPLSVAVSDDGGMHWRRHGRLEPENAPSHCYYSIAFQGEAVLFTYYEGVMMTDPSGVYRPRNLASLKLRIVHRRFFERDAEAPGVPEI